jgi:immune inhibitor A
LLVWHIDDAQPGNTDENHYKVGLLQADGDRDLELNHNRGDAGDPYPGSTNNRSLTATTTPSTGTYTGQDTCVSITNISAAGPTMTATVSVRCAMPVTNGSLETRELRQAHPLGQRGGLSDHRDALTRLSELEARVATLEEELGTVQTEPYTRNELQPGLVSGSK